MDIVKEDVTLISISIMENVTANAHQTYHIELMLPVLCNVHLDLF